MTRPMAVHDAERCGGLRAHCDVCLDSLWHGNPPVMTPLLDAMFLALTTIAIVGFCLFFFWRLVELFLP